MNTEWKDITYYEIWSLNLIDERCRGSWYIWCNPFNNNTKYNKKIDALREMKYLNLRYGNTYEFKLVRMTRKAIAEK